MIRNAILWTCLAASAWAEAAGRPSWADRVTYAEGGFVYAVGVAAGVDDEQEGRLRAFRNGVAEIMNYAGLRSFDGIVLESMESHVESDEDGKVAVYRLFRVGQSQISGRKAAGAKPAAARDASSLSVEGRWRGRYSYPKTAPDGQEVRMPPVNFSVSLEEEPAGFHGEIHEGNTFNDDSAKALRADILGGVVDKTGVVRFTKKYDGTGGVSHPVEYVGSLSEDGRRIAGRWMIEESWSGRFEMRRE